MAQENSIPRSLPLRKTGDVCQTCGEPIWEVYVNERWERGDCLECVRNRKQQEWVSETLRVQAEKSKTLYSQASFENFITTAKYQERGLTAAQEFYANVTKGIPVALLLFSYPIHGYSGYGTGKTHLASAISNALREDGWNILSWLAPDIFSEIKGTYGNDDAEQTEWGIVRMATGCDILVFDDVGKEHVRDQNRSWHQDLYYRIINARYQRGPLVVTTNLDAEELPHHIGGAAFSRLWEMCDGNKLIIEMCGPDYRFRKKEKEHE